jgi:hypothetical protein
MSVKQRFLVAVAILAFSTGFSAYAQFGNSAAVKESAAPKGLGGIWVLKTVNSIASNAGPKPATQNVQLTFGGDTSGGITSNIVDTIAEAGKPSVTCHQSIAGNFTTAVIGAHSYLRMASAPETAGRDCGPYAGKTKPYPAIYVMYELTGDTLKTIEFAQSGPVIYTYARGQVVAAPAR